MTEEARIRARRAARTATVIAAGLVGSILVRIVLDDRRRPVNWSHVLAFAGILGGGSFALLFVVTYFCSRVDKSLEAILAREPGPLDKRGPAASGFVAMEYYAGIWNRTFVVFIAPEGLYGWKAVGAVTPADPGYFQPFADMLQDPELMQDMEAIKELSHLKGGFFIPRADIVSADFVQKPKWGMGGIPHCGRILVRLTSGASREFILLGSVDGESLRRQIGRPSRES